MKAITLIAILLFNLSLLVGTAYLIEVHKWNPLWMLFAVLFFFTLKEEPH